MPMHRKNKTAWGGDRGVNQGYFTHNLKRQRKRAKMQRKSRRINRGR